MKPQTLPTSIQNLNLDAIKIKLIKDKQFLSIHELNQAEDEYKQFLSLCITYPNQELGINKSADTFWHYHILDTHKYMNDCNDIFGSYLHHNPNLFEGSQELYLVAQQTSLLQNKELVLEDFVGCSRI